MNKKEEELLSKLLSNGFNDFENQKSKIRHMLNEFVESLLQPISLEEYGEIISPKLDDLIRKEKAKSWTYLGGTLSYELIETDKFCCKFVMFFQDNKEQFYRQKGEFGPFKLNKLIIESQNKIRSEKKIEFEYNDPDIN